MDRIITIILFLMVSSLAFGQSIEELEQSLKEAETRKERMHITYQLGEKYLRVDSDKALDNAKKASKIVINIMLVMNVNNAKMIIL